MISNDSFSNKPLNILKASLPYMPFGIQMAISYYVKFEEFNLMINSLNDSLDNTLSACNYNTSEERKFKPSELINAVKPYLNNDERNLIEMFMNMVNAFNMYDTYKSVSLPAVSNVNVDSPKTPASGLDIDALKNMLSPSQKAMFDTYSAMLNTSSS